MNVPDKERVVSGVFGALLLAAASQRGGPLKWLMVAAGGALLRRAWSGRCPLYRGLDVDRRHDVSGVPGNRGLRIEHSIKIRRSPEVLFAFWRNLENLPHVMRHVSSVRSLSDRRSRWEISAPLGQTMQWDAEILSEEAGRFISWQSLPGASVSNAGSVWFEPTPSGSTTLKVALQYDPPAGAVGAALATLLGSSPQKDLATDLASFKEYAERELSPTGQSGSGEG